MVILYMTSITTESQIRVEMLAKDEICNNSNIFIFQLN